MNFEWSVWNTKCVIILIVHGTIIFVILPRYTLHDRLDFLNDNITRLIILYARLNDSCVDFMLLIVIYNAHILHKKRLDVYK